MSKCNIARAEGVHTFLKHSIHGITLGHCWLQRLPLGRPQQLLVGSRLQLIAVEQPVGYGQQAGVTAIVLTQDSCTAQHVAAIILVDPHTDKTTFFPTVVGHQAASIALACAPLCGMSSDRYQKRREENLRPV